MIGTSVLTFTQRVLTLLRYEDKITQELPLLDNNKENQIGRIKLLLKLIPTTFENKVNK